jgi:hypothetical protein
MVSTYRYGSGVCDSGVGIEIGASAVIRDRVEPHAAAVDSCAASMEAAGIGGGLHGHVETLRQMAGCMRADAARGTVPSIYRNDSPFTAAGEKLQGNNAMKDFRPASIFASDGEKFNLSVQAMKQTGHYRSIAYLLKREKIEIHRPVSIAELDEALAKSALATSDRLNVKCCLSRAGLLV